ncbi:MAG: hybrid sensor histidine kinase/response regulator [Elusimicrobia bacterium]|nr:hybrid sensor histidine kinase/response regulator [Elusimicrobiota bacterium]
MEDRAIRGLLIEDDPEESQLLMTLLAQPESSSGGFQFTCAPNLKTGLQVLVQGGIEVILLDLMLPDSRGIETVRKVHSQAPDIPIVVFTAMSDEALGLEAMRCGAQDYQIKGEVKRHALKRTITYAVERCRMLRSLKNTITGSPDGIVIVDSAGVIRHSNPAADCLLRGLGQPLVGLAFPFPIPEGGVGDIRIPVPGDGELIVELRATEIEWDDQPARLLLLRDITELCRIEKLKAEIREVRKLDQLKDELVSTVSHEIRNPLAVIKGTAYLINLYVNGNGSGPPAEACELQLLNIKRLEKIVANILDISRLESGQARMELQPVDIAALIRETVRDSALLSDRKDVAIRYELEPGLPQARADQDLVVQVLLNLLANALRFANSLILVRARAVNGNIQVNVCDDGPGIPPENLGDLFKKFVQIRRSSQGDGYKGTGLGLALCKEILERQGGRIWVENGAGLGASFFIELPREEPRVGS